MTYPKDQLGVGDGSGESSASVSAQIAAKLAPYATSASVATALGGYITSASVASMVAGYLTSASANLGQYVTSGSLATALTPYLTSASAASVYVSSNSVSGMIASQLTPYITSASVATALTPYLTSASAAGVYISSNSVSGMITTRLAPYLTSASAALSTYVTSGSLATALGTYVTSSSLATALSPYLTSASAAAAYMTSNSVSVMVAAQIAAAPPGSGETSASISLMIASRLGGLYTATASLTAITVAGRPVGSVLLGYQALSNVTQFSFSGSWSDFAVLQMYAAFRLEQGTSATMSAAVYSDGGTTPFLSLPTVSATASANQVLAVDMMVFGGNGTGNKVLRVDLSKATNLANVAITATANTSFVNALKYFTSRTMTAGMACLFGWRTS
jgi:hypothetical protein